MKRRNFIQVSSLGALCSTISLPLLGDNGSSGIAKSISESEQQVSVKGDFDVVVCGGGPAGVMAAIEAGRSGARTMLIEWKGCLGGVWTAGLLSWILDQKNKSGLLEEIREELKKRDAVCPIPTNNEFAFDVEAMKLLLEELCLDAGVQVRLHTSLVAAKIEDRRVSHAITESKSGREAWGAKVFIDCTGDGDLAQKAGCNFDFGDKTTNEVSQPFSLLALISGVSFDHIKPYVRWKEDYNQQSKQDLLTKIREGGFEPSYKKPGIYPISNDLFMLMANQEYGYNGTNADHVTQATMRARYEINEIVKSLKKTGEPWNHLKVVVTAEQIGIREGRRIHGLYTVSQANVVSGQKHDDAVCRVQFGVDVHSVSESDETKMGRYNRGIKSKDYDIPLRALIAKDVDGLLMAGRCISGDFIAHSSYRVTGNAAIMGQAAGRVAAVSAERNVLPTGINFRDFGLDQDSII